MSASVADDMIRSFFERWQRLEEEKRANSDDLKELFAEAKGNGLDAKALRTVFREQVGDKNAAQEFDAICDLYRSSLNAPRAGRTRESQSYAEAKGFEAREQFIEKSGGIGAALSAALGVEVEMVRADPETGELTDTQEQPEEPATIQPPASPADDGGHPSIPTDDAREAGGGAVEPITFSQSSEAVTLSSSVAPPPPGETDRAGAESSPASAAQFINPRCQKPNTCDQVHDRNACWDCTMAWATRPKDEQVRLWQEAMEAASETEVA